MFLLPIDGIYRIRIIIFKQQPFPFFQHLIALMDIEFCNSMIKCRAGQKGKLRSESRVNDLWVPSPTPEVGAFLFSPTIIKVITFAVGYLLVKCSLLLVYPLLASPLMY
jgi:hypothetical protein